MELIDSYDKVRKYSSDNTFFILYLNNQGDIAFDTTPAVFMMPSDMLRAYSVHEYGKRECKALQNWFEKRLPVERKCFVMSTFFEQVVWCNKIVDYHVSDNTSYEMSKLVEMLTDFVNAHFKNR